MFKYKTHRPIKSVNVSGVEYAVIDGVLTSEKDIIDALSGHGFTYYVEPVATKEVVKKDAVKG